MAYVAHSEKLGEVKSEKFDYQTPADLSCIWDDYGGESAVPALESELPVV